MLFEAVPQQYYNQTSFIAFICILLFLISIFNIDRDLPSEESKNNVTTLLFLSILGYIPVVFISLPFDDNTKALLFHLGSFWFASFPLVIFVIFCGRETKIHIVKAILLADMALLIFPPLIRPESAYYGFFLIYLPGLTTTVFSFIGVYTMAVEPNKRLLYLHLSFIAGLTGSAFIADFFITGRLWSIPVLTLLMPIWAFFSIIRILSTNNNDSEFKTIVRYITLITVIFIAIGIYKTFDGFFAWRGEPFLMSDNFTLAASICALVSLFLYIFAKRYLENLITSISERLADPFTERLAGIERKAGSDIIKQENLNKIMAYYPETSFLILMRRRNSREYKPFSPVPPAPFTFDDIFSFDPEIEQILQKNGIYKFNPAKAVKLPPDQLLFSRIADILRNGDLIIASCMLDEKSKFLPPAIIIFFTRNGESYEYKHFWNFGKLAKKITSHASRLWIKTNYPPVKIPSSAGRSHDLNGLASDIKDLQLGMPGDDFLYLIARESENSSWESFPISNSEETLNLPKNFDISKKDADKYGLLNLKNITNKGESIKILPLLSRESQAGLVFRAKDDDFVYESVDNSFFTRLSSQLGIIIDRIMISRKIRKNAGEMKDLIIQSEQNLEDYRKEIARELHDKVAQDIYAARMQVHIIEKKITENFPETGEEIEILKQAVSEGLKNTRSLIDHLRNPESQENNLQESETLNFLERTKKETKMKISASGLEILKLIQPGESKEIGMIIREAVNNSRKHANAKNIKISLKYFSGKARLLVIDDGQGFDSKSAKNSGGFGLSSMDSRSRKLGGNISIRSRKGSGAAIRAVIEVHPILSSDFSDISKNIHI